MKEKGTERGKEREERAQREGEGESEADKNILTRYQRKTPVTELLGRRTCDLDFHSKAVIPSLQTALGCLISTSRHSKPLLITLSAN